MSVIFSTPILSASRSAQVKRYNRLLLRRRVQKHLVKKKTQKLGKIVFTLESDYIFGMQIRQYFTPLFLNLTTNPPSESLDIRGMRRSTIVLILLSLLLLVLCSVFFVRDALAPSLEQEYLFEAANTTLVECIMSDIPRPLSSKLLALF